MGEVWEHYNYKHTTITSGGHREEGGGNKKYGVDSETRLGREEMF